MSDWGKQLFRVWVDDPLRWPSVFLKHDYWGRTNLVGLIRGVGECGRAGELCKPKVTITALANVDNTVLVAALAGLLIALAQPRALGAALRGRFRWDEPASRAAAAALFLGAAIVLNAAVCGIFSGPFPRYQARIVWLLPAEAMLLALALVPEAAWSRWRLHAPDAWIEAPQRWAAALWGRLDPAFLRFAVVGTVGFCTDAALLHLFMAWAGLTYFTGRLASFTLAVFVTWTLNRTWTFRASGREGRLKQAAVYFGVQIAGGIANIAVYTAAILMAPVLKHYLLVPLAFGSAAGLCLTYLGSKHLAFRTREQALAAMDTGAA
jgi:putative flippase GtrA